jgi:hypothetical protein
MSIPQAIADLLRGRLVGPWPLVLRAVLGDLRPRFLPKCRVGPGWRAVARNGRVLLASDRPLEELTGRAVLLRLQTWHREVLPGEGPTPRGILLCLRADEGDEPLLTTELAAAPEGACELALDVGGRLWLVFRTAPAAQ